MTHVFISYNQADADFAYLLMVELEKAGIDTWMDKSRLRPGMDWSEEIDTKILSAFALVLVISPNSKASEYVTYEWSFALGAKVPIIPLLRVATNVHPRLTRLQYLDFSGNVRPWQDLIQELNLLRSRIGDQWAPPRDTPRHLLQATLSLENPSIEDRREAIKVLADTDHVIAKEALRHALMNPFLDVRMRAAIALAKVRDESILSKNGIQLLTEAFFGEHKFGRNDDIEIAMDAEQSLICVKEIAYGAVLDLATNSDDNSIRATAVSILGKLGNPDAIPLLLALVRDDNFRREAIDSLVDLKSKEAVELLTEIALRKVPCKNQYDEIAACSALIQIGDTSSITEIIKGTSHPNPTVRVHAIYVLAELSGPSSVPVIRELLADSALHTSDIPISGSHARHMVMKNFRRPVHWDAYMAIKSINSEEAFSLVRDYRLAHKTELDDYETRLSASMPMFSSY